MNKTAQAILSKPLCKTILSYTNRYQMPTVGNGVKIFVLSVQKQCYISGRPNLQVARADFSLFVSIGCNTDSLDCGFLLCNNASNRYHNSITSLRLTVEYHKLITLSRKSHISIRQCYYHIQVRSHGMIDATASHYKVRDSSNNIIPNAFLITNHPGSTKEVMFSVMSASLQNGVLIPSCTETGRKELPSFRQERSSGRETL